MRVARIARPQGHQALGALVLAVLVEPHVPTRRALLAHLPIGTSKAPRGGGTLQTSASLLDGLQQMPLGSVRFHRLRRPCFVRVAHVIPRRLVGHNDPWPSHDNRAAAGRPEKWARVERRLGWPAKHRDPHHFCCVLVREPVMSSLSSRVRLSSVARYANMKPLAGPAIDDFSLQNFNSYPCAELRCRAAR